MLTQKVQEWEEESIKSLEEMQKRQKLKKNNATVKMEVID